VDLGDDDLGRTERALDMYQAYLRGLSMAEVADLYGISTERVRQLFYWSKLPRRRAGWRPPGHPQRVRYLRNTQRQRELDRRSYSAAMSATGTRRPAANRVTAIQDGLRDPRSMSET
jgi:transposase-like protein